MNVFVTGASGFLGKHLVPALARAGHTGIAVSRQELTELPAGWTSMLRPALLSGSVPVGKCDWLIHLEVKQHTPQPTAVDLKDFKRVNVKGTAEWLDWCGRNGVTRFLYFSTIKSVRPNSSGPTDETAVGPPSAPYGESKWEAEQLVRRWVDADARRVGVTVRPAVVYGAGCTANVSAMRDAIACGRFFLVGKNDNIKSLVAVENVTAATTFLMQRSICGCEIFNLVDEESFSVREIDATLRGGMGKRGSSPSMPYILARAAALVGDLSRKIAGHELPIDSTRLNAMLETTWYSCEKLKALGFRHPVRPLQSLK
jgi:nucleoside-diphosphate-sugar epimerase